ncbi:hypothetical protein [Daejeonella sp. JGW-45]|nr:hypothetical protein [Daejeonella sp. JGW-45]
MGSKFHIYSKNTALQLQVAAAGFLRVLTSQYELGDAFLKSSKDFII